MSRTELGRTSIEPGEPDRQDKDMKRLLAKAEQTIRKLEKKVADQKQRIRELHAQAKHDDGLAAERDELKVEIVDLKGEARELTRANREYVEKLDALRAENAKLKADARLRRPNGSMSTGETLARTLQSSLS